MSSLLTAALKCAEERALAFWQKNGPARWSQLGRPRWRNFAAFPGFCHISFLLGSTSFLATRILHMFQNMGIQPPFLSLSFCHMCYPLLFCNWPRSQSPIGFIKRFSCIEIHSVTCMARERARGVDIMEGDYNRG